MGMYLRITAISVLYSYFMQQNLREGVAVKQKFHLAKLSPKDWNFIIPRYYNFTFKEE